MAIKGHFHVYSAQEKGTLDLGMYKKIIEASIEMGDPHYTLSNIL